MPVREFYEMSDILAYVKTHYRSIVSTPWLFVYVPESCPYEFREQLADILQPDTVFALRREEIVTDYDASMQQGLEAFCKGNEFPTFNLISGCFKMFQIKKIPELAPYRRLTVLRDPIDRIIADFNAQNRASGTQGSPLTLLEFAKLPANQNVFLQYVTDKGMWQPKECIDFILNEFDFVGIAEDMTMTIKLFYSLFGMRTSPRVVEQQNAASDLHRKDVSTQIIDNIGKMNGLDYDIYNFFRKNFVDLKDKFFELSDYGRMFKKLALKQRA